MRTFFCSLYTGTKQQLSLIKRNFPEGSHIKWKDVDRLEQICCGWILQVTFCLNKRLKNFPIRTVQDSRMCTAVVNCRVKQWLVLHVENC